MSRASRKRPATSEQVPTKGQESDEEFIEGEDYSSDYEEEKKSSKGKNKRRQQQQQVQWGDPSDFICCPESKGLRFNRFFHQLHISDPAFLQELFNGPKTAELCNRVQQGMLLPSEARIEWREYAWPFLLPRYRAFFGTDEMMPLPDCLMDDAVSPNDGGIAFTYLVCNNQEQSVTRSTVVPEQELCHARVLLGALAGCLPTGTTCVCQNFNSSRCVKGATGARCEPCFRPTGQDEVAFGLTCMLFSSLQFSFWGARRGCYLHSIISMQLKYDMVDLINKMMASRYASPYTLSFLAPFANNTVSLFRCEHTTAAVVSTGKYPSLVKNILSNQLFAVSSGNDATHQANWPLLVRALQANSHRFTFLDAHSPPPPPQAFDIAKLVACEVADVALQKRAVAICAIINDALQRDATLQALGINVEELQSRLLAQKPKEEDVKAGREFFETRRSALIASRLSFSPNLKVVNCSFGSGSSGASIINTWTPGTAADPVTDLNDHLFFTTANQACTISIASGGKGISLPREDDIDAKSRVWESLMTTSNKLDVADTCPYNDDAHYRSSLLCPSKDLFKSASVEDLPTLLGKALLLRGFAPSILVCDYDSHYFDLLSKNSVEGFEVLLFVDISKITQQCVFEITGTRVDINERLVLFKKNGFASIGILTMITTFHGCVDAVCAIQFARGKSATGNTSELVRDLTFYQSGTAFSLLNRYRQGFSPDNITLLPGPLPHSELMSLLGSTNKMGSDGTTTNEKKGVAGQRKLLAHIHTHTHIYTRMQTHALTHAPCTQIYASTRLCMNTQTYTIRRLFYSYAWLVSRLHTQAWSLPWCKEGPTSNLSKASRYSRRPRQMGSCALVPLLPMRRTTRLARSPA